MSRIKVPEAERVAFGRRIKAIRSRRNLTQRWLAREVGITCAGISFIEAGGCCPSAATLERLADVLGVTMDELWRGIDRRQSP